MPAQTPQKPEDPNAPYFTIREVAYILRVSVNTVRRRINAGAPHSQAQRYGVILVSREDLPAFYDQHRVGAATRRRPSPARRSPRKRVTASPAHTDLANAA
ncbi:helix-turn-helix domain-containing protein [Streptomyces sp. NPDC001940]